MEPKTKKLNIDEWREFAKAGANIYVKIEPTGVSMRPLIRGGRDMVIVEPMRREPLRGDIVLFLREDGAHVMHRIWKIEGEMVTTYGDGCWYPDKPINKEKIIGLASKLYRGKTGKAEKKISVTNDKMVYKNKPINLDTKFRRKTGLFWLGLAPLRRTYYRVRNIGHSIKRRLFS